MLKSKLKWAIALSLLALPAAAFATEPQFGPVSIPTITPGQNPIWVSTHAWTPADESGYSQWITATDIPALVANAGIKVDCANLAIMLRWIYAHDHALPAANTLYTTGQLFGSFSTNAAWDALPTNPDWTKDRRFIAAIEYVLNGTYTHSILKDLYPVALTRDYVTPGTVLLVLYSTTTGHTQIVKSVGPAPECDGGECVMVNYASEPADTIVWREPAWVNQGLSNAGFLHWRWPVQVNGVWQLADPTTMPGYSTVQYSQPSMDETQYDSWVYQQLGLKITDAQFAIEMANLFHDIAHARIDHLYDVLYLCKYSGIMNCAPGTAGYENFSTPARDERLRLGSAEFLAHAQAKDAVSSTDLQILLNTLAADLVIIWGGPSVKDLLLDTGGILERLNPDPRVSTPERWGIATTDPGYDEAQYLSLGAFLLQYFGANRMERVELRQDSADLDPSIKAVQKELLARPAAAVSMPSAMKAAFLVSLRPAVTACAWNAGGVCTDYDVIFGRPEWLQQMSATATDSPAARFGIPATP